VAHRTANPRHRIARSLLAAGALSLATLAAQSSHVPPGHRPPGQTLANAIREALPAGATELSKPLPVHVGDLGLIHVAVYRRTAGDGLFHALAILTDGSTYRAVPLPEGPEAPGNYEEIVTSVLSANLTGTPDSKTRALVILYYTHHFGQTGSKAFGRVYRYDGKAFSLDEPQSSRLNDVRTAALARLRLETPPQ
jgi:hypothetical protein